MKHAVNNYYMWFKCQEHFAAYWWYVISGSTYTGLTQGRVDEISPWWSPAAIHMFTQLSVAMVSLVQPDEGIVLYIHGNCITYRKAIYDKSGDSPLSIASTTVHVLASPVLFSRVKVQAKRKNYYV